jgi:hypothetical protein
MTAQALTLSRVDLGGHDVGVHLHPQDPVLAKRLGERVRITHDGLGRYPADHQALLVQAAREIFEEALGRSPRLFVAGRWSEDSATPALLAREGFTHDASPLPGHRSPFADWSRIPRLAQPYHPAAEDRQRSGSEPLLYIPVYRGIWQDYMTPERIRAVGPSYFEAGLQEARVGGADVIHFYFHSPLGLDPEAMRAFEEVLVYARDVIGAQPTLPSALTPSVRRASRPFPPAYLAHLDWRLARSLVGRNGLGRRLMGSESDTENGQDLDEVGRSGTPP